MAADSRYGRPKLSRKQWIKKRRKHVPGWPTAQSPKRGGWGPRRRSANPIHTPNYRGGGKGPY